MGRVIITENGVIEAPPEIDKMISDAIAAYDAKREEMQWEAVRLERNALLADCDYVITKSIESSVSIPTEWIEYRQSLRDITLQEDPFNITWPEKPA